MPSSTAKPAGGVGDGDSEGESVGLPVGVSEDTDPAEGAGDNACGDGVGGLSTTADHGHEQQAQDEPPRKSVKVVRLAAINVHQAWHPTAL